MSAKDISRFLFQPEKRYSSVRMQQGRVILDSDWNESERIDDEEARRTLIDIVCSKGTSNDGFRVSDVRSAVRRVAAGGDVEIPFVDVETYDFDIGPGSYYLGGLRFETGDPRETYLTQNDWLQINLDTDGLPNRPEVGELRDPNGNVRERFDFVYLRGWEQCVTAVEDSELREQALGGPDTSVRIRRMRRVEILEDTVPDCGDAFEITKNLLARSVAGDRDFESHTLDPGSCELVSNARLTVGLSDDGITEDPCKPKVEGGFLGAENQTIRVELTAPDRFIWGIDNASPYYRVQVEIEEGAASKIKFLTQPRDQHAQPLQGQAVEIHPWGALLPNQEKVAELQGHLSTVASSYDPETQTLTLSDPVPQAWLDWLDNPDNETYQSKRDPDGQRKYFYLRLWTGGSGSATEPDVAFTPGDPVDLTGTGLTVTFSQPGLPGDHWIIAARPNTPDVVVAWELMDQAPPAGTRFFFAPLGMIRWSLESDIDVGERVAATVHDCRTRFSKLCETRGCCTVTVGDGRTSHGDYHSIQEAIDALPPEGGEICVLPGIHNAAVTIRNRRNIRIHGCGKQTLIIPVEQDRGATLFRVIDSHCISISRMDMMTISGIAVVVGGTGKSGSTDFEILQTRVLACLEAIRIERATGVYIFDNHIRLLDKEGGRVAILVSAEDALIERNDIGVVPARPPRPGDDPDDDPDPEDPCEDPDRIFGDFRFLARYLTLIFRPLLLAAFVPFRAFRALGGIQLAAGCERVRVLENKIIGGAGNGITLGGAIASVLEPPEEEDPPVILINRGVVRGFLHIDGESAAGADLALSLDDDIRSTVTGSDGYFSIAAPDGEYGLALMSAGLRINDVTEVRDTAFPRITVNATRLATAPSRDLAFLYGIRIDENEIFNMGLSGIGSLLISGGAGIVRSAVLSRAVAAVVRNVGNPVIGLKIRRNHIARCLHRPFDDVMRRIVRVQGLGGISLGTVVDTQISGNQIERNGINHVRPVCGVFIKTGAEIEVHENRIVENGVIDPNRLDTSELGVRGGVVVAALAATVNLSPLKGREDATRSAVRVHDNVIIQPHGHALRLLARGSVSATDNRLSTERPEPVPRTPSVALATFSRTAAQYPAGVALISNYGNANRDTSGLVSFNDNQLRLETPVSVIAGTLLYSEDDVSFADNQTEVVAAAGAGGAVFTNVWIVSRTLRARGNRFREIMRGAKYGLLASLVSASALRNNSGNNQADHCIFPFNQIAAHPPVQTDNQIIDSTRCGRFISVIDFELSRSILRLFRR